MSTHSSIPSPEGDLRRHFVQSVWNEAATLVEQDRVEVIAGAQDDVWLLVSEARAEEVALRMSSRGLHTDCSCEEFEAGHLCVHLCAAVQYALSKDLLPREISLLIYGLPESEEEPQESGGSAVATQEPELIPAADEEVVAPEKDHAKERDRIQPAWAEFLVAMGSRRSVRPLLPKGEGERQLVYFVDPSEVREEARFVLHLGWRERIKSGDFGPLQLSSLPRSEAEQILSAEDSRILELLSGAITASSGTHRWERFSSCVLTENLLPVLLPRLCATRRLLQQDSSTEDAWNPKEVEFDDAPFMAELCLDRPGGAGAYRLSARFVRGQETVELDRPRFIVAPGFFLLEDTLSSFQMHGSLESLDRLRERGSLWIPEDQIAEFQRRFDALERPPFLAWPQALARTETHPSPVPRIRIRGSVKGIPMKGAGRRLFASVSFLYGRAQSGPVEVEAEDNRSRVTDLGGSIVVRDFAAEERALERLGRLGFRLARERLGPGVFGQLLEVEPDLLASVVGELNAHGWKVEAEGAIYRRPNQVKVSVRSGIDWFDLEGGACYDQQMVSFPQLLEAVRQGRGFVVLGDGSRGLLPEEWLGRNGFLLRSGEAAGEALRYRSSQTALLDALLLAEPEAEIDPVFARAREELGRFEGIRPMAAPAGFHGTLRPYQELGLSWIQFLEKFGFGGCLADDMGLGKTIQVLAALECRRENNRRPALVVVPRSLIFNWKDEALRFTPGIRVLEHIGPSRSLEPATLLSADVVLTTYGTLRRDAALLKDIEFDYVVLDEAQSIKNRNSATAKAARLLHSRHRLALSGTPIENHLGEFWSLFEFLNPGMLGRASVFRDAALRVPEGGENAGGTLVRALRPFLLRRTKQQVARELPPKMEQTIYSDLDPVERRTYDELKRHYQVSFFEQMEEKELRRSRIQVLEALLRLRQASCHLGLLDERRRPESSTKLNLLLDHLEEVLEEGHKALVFSQFTSFLAIVREHLDARKVVYEYLDGQTRNREARVKRFQNDKDCKLFLISLKAGGQGLNLTAAEYVFLLDPWWNPAVEAQAIDRAHRIGQTQQVFAYRLVARDTVEEKVLQLQAHKKRLADAILGGESGMLDQLSRDDLRVLLS